MGAADDKQMKKNPSSAGDLDSRDGQPTEPAATGFTKEVEPRAQEKKLMSEIIQTSEALDRENLKNVQEDISEAKSAVPEPEIPPDVADAGVKAPQAEADEVAKKGSTIDLPISEEKYNQSLHQKLRAKVTSKSVVFGVNSLLALVAWAGRIIKIAHNHAKKVVFRKPSFASSSAKATDDKKASEGKEVKDAD